MTRLIALIVTQYVNNIYNITQVKEVVKKEMEWKRMNYVQNKEVKKLISLEEKRQIYITYSALERN